MPFQIMNRKTVFQSRVFSLEAIDLLNPGRQHRTYDLVNHMPSVTIVPLDQEGNVWFVNQYRVGADRDLLELPAGVAEAGEPPEAAASREIREEIGMSAGQLKKLGAFYLAPGYSTEWMTVFLATGLQPGALPPDEDEFLQVVKLPAAEALRKIDDGSLLDGKTLAALSLARPYLLK